MGYGKWLGATEGEVKGDRVRSAKKEGGEERGEREDILTKERPLALQNDVIRLRVSCTLI